MKKTILLLLSFFAYYSAYAQITESSYSIIPENNNFNISSGSYILSEASSPNVFIEENSEFTDFEFDCSTDFFTINDVGIIQKWSLQNNTVSGGDTVLLGGGSGLAYCGDNGVPTFYSSNYPDTGINYYDNSNNNWTNISTPVPVLNNGGHSNHQYYMGVVNGSNRVLYSFDGSNLTTIDSLTTESFTVFDTAVDTLGQAWVFRGNTFTTTSELNIYDNNGLLSTFDLNFDSEGTYGTFFLNGTLYIGVFTGEILPVIINGSTAQLGSPIPFPNFNFFDMASCQNNGTVNISTIESLKNNFKVFPNPTDGIIYLPQELDIRNIEIYNIQGERIKTIHDRNQANLSNLPVGMYIIHIVTPNGSFNKSIIKQ